MGSRTNRLGLALAAAACVAHCAPRAAARPTVVAHRPADLAPGRQTWFSPDTLEQLQSSLAAGGYLVAVVRCRSAEIALRGTRSEQVRIAADVLAVGAGPRSGALELVRYTHGDPLMAPGRVYLVAAMPSSELLEAVAVDPAQASEIANEAARQVRAQAPYAP